MKINETAAVSEEVVLLFESAGGKVHICTKLGVQACAFFIQAENRAIRDKTEFAKSEHDICK